jgi:hypothetical protein
VVPQNAAAHRRPSRLGLSEPAHDESRLVIGGDALPYVGCTQCGLPCFSAARWSNIDLCAACGAELPRRACDAGALAGPTDADARSVAAGSRARPEPGAREATRAAGMPANRPNDQ